MKLILIKFSILLLLTSLSLVSQASKNIISIEQHWVSTTYRKCLATKLPCDCSTRPDRYLYINIDTVHDECIILPVESNETYLFDLQKSSSNEYIIIEKSNDSIRNLGSIRYIDKQLQFTDTTRIVTTFVQYVENGIDNYSDQWYEIYNITLINGALQQRNYPSMEAILNRDSLYL
ncbi:hypothetical protein QNI16_34445 [Cytophagaceae bacterium YF14B1]|uniref:Uncharacterized protein n=1 Tax=Xanthocytophaga flava TaxID=3048013 RepID=A0AAE3UBC4_9BACT|nr:hypothetical protein [Xanthocytophaga flavus]MDJ1485642.1 hypothetical protein [Xanthocytophaga flavus]